MTPALVLSNIAAVARTVSASNLWVARGLRQRESPSNRMRQYARLAVRIEQVGAVRERLQSRMVKQTPRAVNLIQCALAVYDNEIERITHKQVATGRIRATK